MTSTPPCSASASFSHTGLAGHLSKAIWCAYLTAVVLAAPAAANASPSASPRAGSLVSVEDDDGYLSRDDHQSLRQRSRRAPAASGRAAQQADPGRAAQQNTTEPLGIGGVLLVGATVFLTAGAVAVPATVIAAVVAGLPFVGIVLAIGCLAIGVGLPSMAGSKVAEALGADGSSVQLGAAVGAGVGIAGGLAVGAASIVVGLGGTLALAMAAEARGTAGNGVAFGLLPLFGLAASGVLTVAAVAMLTAGGAGIGAITGGVAEMGPADAPSELNE